MSLFTYCFVIYDEFHWFLMIRTWGITISVVLSYTKILGFFICPHQELKNIKFIKNNVYLENFIHSEPDLKSYVKSYKVIP